jgi:hypothetical protein
LACCSEVCQFYCVRLKLCCRRLHLPSATTFRASSTKQANFRAACQASLLSGAVWFFFSSCFCSRLHERCLANCRCLPKSLQRFRQMAAACRVESWSLRHRHWGKLCFRMLSDDGQLIWAQVRWFAFPWDYSRFQIRRGPSCARELYCCLIYVYQSL